jgi:hypothetical protein
MASLRHELTKISRDVSAVKAAIGTGPPTPQKLLEKLRVMRFTDIDVRDLYAVIRPWFDVTLVVGAAKNRAAVLADPDSLPMDLIALSPVRLAMTIACFPADMSLPDVLLEAPMHKAAETSLDVSRIPSRQRPFILGLKVRARLMRRALDGHEGIRLRTRVDDYLAGRAPPWPSPMNPPPDIRRLAERIAGFDDDFPLFLPDLPPEGPRADVH